MHRISRRDVIDFVASSGNPIMLGNVKLTA